jgi:hypothetical protein
MLELSFRSNVDAISRQLTDLAREQLPFAEARALTELAKLAAQAEKQAMPRVFNAPVPFTVNSVAVQPARKGKPVARVYVRDKAAAYLEPYEYGGTQFLGKKPGDLVPVNARANVYGNLPRNAMRQYLGRDDTFLGTVRTQHGPIYGLWQRPAKFVGLKFGKRRGAPKVEDKSTNISGKMKLIVAIHKPVSVTKRLDFATRAEQVVRANFNRVFGAELARAIATAKPRQG